MVKIAKHHGGVQRRWPAKEAGASSTVGVAVNLSDTETSEDDSAAKRNNSKLKMVAKDQGPPPGRHHQGVFDKSMSKLLSIFPDACPDATAARLTAQLRKTSPGIALQRITNQFLSQGVPRPAANLQQEPKPELLQGLGKQVVEVQRTAEGGAAGLRGQQKDDLQEIVPPEIQDEYYAWSMYSLMQEFPRYPTPDLKRVLAENKYRYTPSHQVVRMEYAAALAVENDGADKKGGKKRRSGRPRRSKLNKCARQALPHRPATPCIFFEREWMAVQRALGVAVEHGKCVVKEEARYENGKADDACKAEGEGSGSGSGSGSGLGDIECGCCCSDYPFEEMAQCAEGHLFCFGCLRRRVEESTFGGAQACGFLPCMDTGGCEESFPWSEVKRALPPEVFSKYEQRQAEDAVVQAKLSGLVYCPFCNMPWEVDPDLRVLECENESCKKASCLMCKEPSHIPLRCEEVEKRSETSLRRSIEELMTKALIRVCTACKAELVKSDGCNKVTCRCGQTMCYVCRKPIAANYQHFCQHVRAPGKECSTCKNCSLWHEEAEEEVVTAAREAAMKDLAKDEPSLLKRTIGPKLDKPPKKKPHHPRFPVVPAPPFRLPPPEYYHQLVQAMVAVGDEAAD